MVQRILKWIGPVIFIISFIELICGIYGLPLLITINIAAIFSVINAYKNRDL